MPLPTSSSCLHDIFPRLPNPRTFDFFVLSVDKIPFPDFPSSPSTLVAFCRGPRWFMSQYYTQIVGHIFMCSMGSKLKVIIWTYSSINVVQISDMYISIWPTIWMSSLLSKRSDRIMYCFTTLMKIKAMKERKRSNAQSKKLLNSNSSKLGCDYRNVTFVIFVFVCLKTVECDNEKGKKLR